MSIQHVLNDIKHAISSRVVSTTAYHFNPTAVISRDVISGNHAIGSTCHLFNETGVIRT